MLKKCGNKVSENWYKIVFVKLEFWCSPKKVATDQNDDPFNSIAKNDENAIGALEFDLNQLCEVNLKLSPDDLEADKLINIGPDVTTSNAQPLTLEEIVNWFRDEPSAEIADGEGNDDENVDNGESTMPIAPPMHNNIDERVKTLTS